MALSVRRLAAVLALATLTACENYGPTGPVTGGRTSSIDIKDNFFSPSNDTVSVGATITWTWRGSNPHTVTFDAGGTNSSQMTSGTFQRQFPAAGSFTYHCLVHGTAMSGTIVVQ